MRIRLEDVARRAGVSPKTVSRVLNEEPNVRESTRAKVLTVVAEMDYRPHPAARRLASNQSFMVATLYDNPSASYLTEIQDGVLDACDQFQYSMLVRPLHVEAEDFVQRVDQLISDHRPDGLILTPPVSDHPGLLERLKERNMPYASVSPRDREDTIGVYMDERCAAADMLNMLIRLGHRRIAHVIGHAGHGASALRLGGYQDALEQAGIEQDPRLVVQGDFSFESGVEAAYRLFALADRPSAIFAGNDDMASGVIWAAAEHNLRIPEDVSLCGFDDTPISRQVWPRLTTIHQPVREMGRLACLQLLEVLRGRGRGSMMQLQYSLQLRDSIRPASDAQHAANRSGHYLPARI